MLSFLDLRIKDERDGLPCVVGIFKCGVVFPYFSSRVPAGELYSTEELRLGFAGLPQLSVRQRL